MPFSSAINTILAASLSCLVLAIGLIIWQKVRRNYYQLQERTMQLQMALAAAQTGLWSRDLVTEELTASPELEQLCNVPPGSFAARSNLMEEIFHPEDLIATQAKLRQAIADRQPYQDECRISWPDGTVRWLEIRGQCFYDDNGNPLRLVGTCVDITDRKLAEVAQQQQIDRERMLTKIAQRIRSSLQLSDILTTVVEEVRSFLQTDRVIVFQFDDEWNGRSIVESVDPQWISIQGMLIDDPCFRDSYVEPFRQGLVTAKSDIQDGTIDQCHLELLEGFQVRANLVVPIMQDQNLWGLLIAHHCSDIRQWQPNEIELLQQLSVQLDIALQQASLLTRLQAELEERAQIEASLQEAKTSLEKRVARRTSELQRYTAELQDLYHNAPCGYHSLDADGYFIMINDTELGWLGYQREEVIGKAFVDLLTPNSGVLFRKRFLLFKQQGHIENLEFELIRKDGSVLPVSLNATIAKNEAGHYLMSRSTTFDISDRRATQAALQESARRWQALRNDVQLVVVSLDLYGNVEYINPFFLDLTDYKESEVLGKNWFDCFLSAESRPQSNLAFHEFLENNIHTYYENAIVTKMGKERAIAWNNILLRNDHGGITGIISIGADITKRQEIDRLKSEFVSTVSHELRTPLTAIRGSLGLLAAGVYNKKPEKHQQMLTVAAEQTDRLVRLVNDILDLQRLESDKVELVREVCDAADLVHQAVAAIQTSADAEQIKLLVAVESMAVWAFPDAILQTLTNLLGNAIKFSEPGGTIWLEAKAEDDQVLFSVRDRGRGIPSDRLEAIFERFHQVDASDSRQKGGTGLGLAICRHIVEQHNGRTWAESVLGEGSTFYFTLPASIE
jgi:PAS domain S-box-containing protein